MNDLTSSAHFDKPLQVQSKVWLIIQRLYDQQAGNLCHKLRNDDLLFKFNCVFRKIKQLNRELLPFMF